MVKRILLPTAFACGLLLWALPERAHVEAVDSSASRPFGTGDGGLDLTFNPGGTGLGPLGQSGVNAVAVEPDGQILVAGNFFTYNKDPDASDHIMRLTPTGGRDALFNASGSGPNGAVSAVAVRDTKIVIGGTFTSYNGETAAPDAVIRLNGDGTRDTGFNAGGTGTDGIIAAVAIQADGKMIIGGGYAGYNGDLSAPDRIMRLMVDGERDAAFNVGGTGLSGGAGPSFVHAVTLQPDGKILVAGNFAAYNGNAAASDNLLRLNSDGSLDATFNIGGTGANSQVRAIALQPDGKILIGGEFTGYNGDTGHPDRVMRLNSDGTPDPSFNLGGVGPNLPVFSLAVQPDGKAVIGGQFTTYNGDASANDRVMRLNTNGTRDATFNAGGDGSNGTISALAMEGTKILIGGLISTYNGNEAAPDRIARLNGSVATPTPTPNTLFDYDGDRKTDFSVFRPSSGAWYLQRSSAGFQGLQFGVDSDQLAPADYDGDGKTDIAVYRPSAGQWYVLNSGTGTVSFPLFGVAEDVPAPGDYDGDGKADVTVFRPSQGTWYRQNSSDGSFFAMQFGATGDVPTVGDFDEDGKNDLGIFRPSNGDWYNLRSADGSVFGERFGQTGDKIAPADYDGDGKTDIAIFRPSTGQWVVRNSATATYSFSVFGAVNDVPVAGDYDGDGKADIGVWRAENGTWYVQRSSNGEFIVFPWGQNGDVPTPSAFGN